MPDDPVTIEPQGPYVVEPMAADTVAPGSEHLGLFCAGCGKPFSLIGPLDPDKISPGKPLNIRAQSPILHATCKHCGHQADYPIGELRRLSLP